MKGLLIGKKYCEEVYKMTKIEIGVMTLQDTPWDEMVSRWQRIEEAGFASVWLSDHFVDFSSPRRPWFEAWTLLSALAVKTSRIRFGTLVSPVGFRNPAVLARQALTIDHISNGRLNIGLGAGISSEIDSSYRMIGVPDYSPRERVERVQEAVEIISCLLTREVTTYRGKHYRFQEATVNPRPVQQPRPPIVLAAEGKKMIRIAAQFADVWNTYGSNPALSDTQLLSEIKERNELLNTYCAELDRDPASIKRSLLVYGAALKQMYSSYQGFLDLVGAYQDVGIQEFVIYYPFNQTQMPIFERIMEDFLQ
jgi:alkanesulfonate monooxygenase SsuD/methylene tetrahydromethanopterin reductase-like flavin-dependent oxidoreductase (luciferase family)